MTLTNSKVIGILFNADDVQDILQVKSFIKYLVSKNIEVHVLGFVNSNNMDSIHLSSLHFNYFNKNDLNFIGIPYTIIPKSFHNRYYDILINFSVSDSFPIKYLAVKSDAAYKVGPYNNKSNSYYDLMIKLKLDSIEYFIQNVVHYLELIDKNNEK